MDMSTVEITVFWENDCGETIYEEVLTAVEVWNIILTDPKAPWNRYLLPSGRTVDSYQFSQWFKKNAAPISVV